MRRSCGAAKQRAGLSTRYCTVQYVRYGTVPPFEKSAVMLQHTGTGTQIVTRYTKQ